MTNEQEAAPEEIGVDQIDESLVVRFRSAVAAVELDGEAVLLDGATGAVHTLNTTATMVWQCCDGDTSLGEIIDDLDFVFEQVGRDAIAADVLQLARNMGLQGLLEGVRAAAPESNHQHHEHHHHPDEGAP